MAHNPEGRHSPDFNRPNMNLVLCGSDTTLTMTMSKMLRGKKINPSDERAVIKDFVKKEEKISGRLLSVVELPALSRLSEEEVMRQTLLSVTLCHPGVHAFICIVPVGPLTDEDKEEVEEIQKIFDSKEHFMVLFTTQRKVEGFATEFVKISSESQSLIRRCGGQYRLMGFKEPENSRQIPDLLDYIENMKTEPYSLQMYVNSQKNRVRRETEERYEEELKRMENEIKDFQQRIQSQGAECSDDLKCLRIVLIGRTGSGKSRTGNTILGREEFVSEASMDSVTTVCEKRVGEVGGRSVSVVDTPGLFDTTLTNEQAVEEIVKCVSLSSPGPHAFVIVLSVGRVTKNETKTLDLIKKIFGPKAAQFSIILFTRGDNLEGESIKDYLKRSNNAALKKLIRDCGDKFLVFNNREKQDRTQVIQLIKMIEEVKNTNQGRYFTNSMFEEAEMNIKYRMEEILKEREREIEAQREKLRVKYDRVMKDMKKRFEEDKNQRADEERMKMEKQFKEEEVQLKKEFEEEETIEQKKRETDYWKHLEEEKQQRAEYHQKTEELRREKEKQRSEYEKQQQKRYEEDRKREEKYRQDREKIKNDQQHNMAELQIRQEEEIKKRDLEKKLRNEVEEEERQKWKRRIKEAENERKEIQEEIKRQQREWEDEKKRQMREREEEERKRKEKHKEQLREKQEELEKMRKRFEREREEERLKMEEEREKQRREREEKERKYKEKKQEMKRYYKQLERERRDEWEKRKREDEEKREEERKRWSKKFEDLKEEQETKRRKKEDEERKKLRTEREEHEREYKEKNKEMKIHYEQLERERKEEWERRKRDDEEIREEERKRWKKMIDDLTEGQEVELKRRESQRIRREEVEQDEIKREYDEKIMETKKKHKDEVRQIEEEFNLREKTLRKEQEKMKTLEKQAVEQRNKSGCAMM